MFVTAKRAVFGRGDFFVDAERNARVGARQRAS